jgi:hypothetical protein
MAGFEVTLHGRFWVITEVSGLECPFASVYEYPWCYASDLQIDDLEIRVNSPSTEGASEKKAGWTSRPTPPPFGRASISNTIRAGKKIRSEDWSQAVFKQASIRLRALGDNSAALRGVP